MELTTKRIVEVSNALNNLHFTCRLKYRDARKLNDLKKLFKSRCEIVANLEQELVRRFNGTVEQNGQIRFETPEDANAFAIERIKLFQEKDDVEFPPVDISKYVDNLEMPVESVEALDGVFIFEHD